MRAAIIVFVVVVIVSYAILRSLNYARGPVINIIRPFDYEAVASSTVMFSGQALRVNNLILNGKAVPIDQAGNFNESIIVFPGVNMITLQASDQFGRSVEKRLQVIGAMIE